MYSASSSAWWFHAATSYATPHPAVPAGAPRPSEPVSLADDAVPGPLQEMLDGRWSCRRFSAEPLERSHLGALLQAGYGILGEARVGGATFAHRSVPSAGARYPLTLYCLGRHVTEVVPGAYRFDPRIRSLEAVGPRPDDRQVAGIFIDQPYVSSAAAIVVVTARLDLTLARYADRGYRYVLFEAGHVGQNLALCAAAIGVGNLQIGGFLDDRLAGVLGLPEGEVPVYAAAVGYPESADPSEGRSVG